MITCSFENGNQAKLRHAVVDNIITKDGQILMVKRAARFLEGGKWGLPGGYMERDETVRQAAERETLEETGWKIADLTLFIIRDTPNVPGEDRQNISFVFFATAIDKIGEADDESDDVQWFPLDSLPPKEQIAFDQSYILGRYKQYLGKKFPLPVLS